MDLKEALRKIKSESSILQPTRFSIVVLLALEGKLSFREIQEALNLSPGNLGSHLKVLEEEGIIERGRCLRKLRYVYCYQLTEFGLRKLGAVLSVAHKVSLSVSESEYVPDKDEFHARTQ